VSSYTEGRERISGEQAAVGKKKQSTVENAKNKALEAAQKKKWDAMPAAERRRLYGESGSYLDVKLSPAEKNSATAAAMKDFGAASEGDAAARTLAKEEEDKANRAINAAAIDEQDNSYARQVAEAKTRETKEDIKNQFLDPAANVARGAPSMTADNMKRFLDPESGDFDAGLEADFEALESRQRLADHARMNSDLQNMNYGGALRAGTELFGGIIGGKPRGEAPDPGAMVAGQLLAAAAQTGGDLLGGWLRGAANERAAEAAAKGAGAWADIKNERERERIMNEAGGELDAANARNVQTAAGMMDGSVQAADGAERAMAGIGASGMDGSSNMTRNIEYAQDAESARKQLQFDIMGNDAAALESSMARSFSDLSQNKAGAMASAWGAEMGGRNAALSNEYAARSKFEFDNQPGPGEWQAAMENAELRRVKRLGGG
jgi:hypothetical protein